MQKWKNNIEKASEKVRVSYMDGRAKTLIKIVKEASDTIDSYAETPNEEKLREKFASLSNLVS